MDDLELLRQYADSRSEAAFSELVRRNVNLVYSVALRQVEGDHHRAEEITQMVFTDLARKADTLVRHPLLLGWLHRGACFAAGNLRREEYRRRLRERIAGTESGGSDESVDWRTIAPLLDEAVNQLSAEDREAVLLRFFENRKFAEIGRRLELNENAARMRVERALARLREALGKRGVNSTAAALALALSQNAVSAAPANFATSAASAALSGVSGVGLLTPAPLVSTAKLILAGFVAAGTAAVVIHHESANTHARVASEDSHHGPSG